MVFLAHPCQVDFDACTAFEYRVQNLWNNSCLYVLRFFATYQSYPTCLLVPPPTFVAWLPSSFLFSSTSLFFIQDVFMFWWQCRTISGSALPWTQVSAPCKNCLRRQKARPYLQWCCILQLWTGLPRTISKNTQIYVMFADTARCSPGRKASMYGEHRMEREGFFVSCHKYYWSMQSCCPRYVDLDGFQDILVVRHKDKSIFLLLLGALLNPTDEVKRMIDLNNSFIGLWVEKYYVVRGADCWSRELDLELRDHHEPSLRLLEWIETEVTSTPYWVRRS